MTKEGLGAVIWLSSNVSDYGPFTPLNEVSHGNKWGMSHSLCLNKSESVFRKEGKEDFK